MLNTQETQQKNPLAHHNPLTLNPRIKNTSLVTKGYKGSYGVQAPYRILTLGVLNKKHDDIRQFLLSKGLTNLEREVAFKLIRFFIYYGKVYPKAQTGAADCYISKRTWWYAVAKLKKMGLLETYQQFCNGYQTSSYYRPDKLVLALARRLAEKGQEFCRRAYGIFRAFTDFWSELKDANIDLGNEAPVQLKFI